MKAKEVLDEHKEGERRRMQSELERLRIEYGAFDEERGRTVDPALAAEPVVDLNIGGTVFETSRSTLTQQQTGFLASILSGRHAVTRDRNGRIFLDRDPEIFRMILNHLRNPAVPPNPRDAAESATLLAEASDLGVNFFPFSLVFAMGGHSGSEYLRAVEVLDASSQCWRPCKPMTTERAYFGSALLSPSKRVCVFGGQNLQYRALCDMEMYDCLRDVWLEGPNMTMPRRNCGGASLGNRIFAVGGFDGVSILKTVESYDTRMKGWIDCAPLTTPRSSCAVMTHDGQIIAVGGTNGENRLRTCEVYDERANQWRALTPEMTQIRSAAAGASLVGHAVCVGGLDESSVVGGGGDFGGDYVGSSGVHASLEILDPDTLKWSQRKPMLMARTDLACTTVADSLLVSGGQNQAVLDTTEFYRPELDEWHQGPSLMMARYAHAMLSVKL